MCLGEHCGRFGWREDGSFEQGSPELTFQFAAGPLLANRHAQVELALFGTLALTENDEMVRPWQLSQQCRDFFIVAVSFVKLPHPKEVRARETAQSRLTPGDVGGQLRYHTVTPLR